MRYFAVLLGFLAGFAPAAAADAPAKPKLIVVISVDQLSANLFAEYRQHFTGGLHRLSEGAVFPSGYQSHAATETCPGHATILTGARPSRSGIIANDWYDPTVAREDKGVYCAEDERVAGSNSGDYTVSPYHLRVKALGDYMKEANRRSRVVSVAGKDRSAVMMAGHNPDQVWWWKNRAAAFVTFDTASPSSDVAEVVAKANADIAAAIAEARAPMPLPDLCRSRLRSVPIEGGGKPMGDGRFARDAGSVPGFRGSPEFDRSTLALASAFRRDMELGEGRATDLLIVGLSATDYVGHVYGTAGSEMCLQLHDLDAALGAFFAELDETGIDYVVVLTADHGGLDIPERARRQGIPGAARVVTQPNIKSIEAEIAASLGLTGPLFIGSGLGDVYFAPSLAAADRPRVLIAAVKAFRAHPQVAAVYTKAHIRATPSPTGPPDAWSLIERARASFDEQRSGDFLVMLKPFVTPIPDTTSYAATHGSPWDYDRRVPILFWRKDMVSFEQPLAVETVDIMPSLAALIGLTVPAGSIDGHCLDLDAGEADTCN